VNKAARHWCEALYETQAAALLLYGRALGLSHSEAEDVLQETFAALLQLAQAPAAPRHYCLRAFRNRALNYRRSLWRRLVRELEARHWFEPSPEHSHWERAAMRALARLPQEQREVIVLKIWHGYSFQAIAELLDTSPNTVAGRYRYGLQKLRAALQTQGYEDELATGESHAWLETPAPVTPH
jgi:RNA polymerase sigma-70 factor (ECF subfamily)